jgi:hypothetical protein
MWIPIRIGILRVLLIHRGSDAIVAYNLMWVSLVAQSHCTIIQYK